MTQHTKPPYRILVLALLVLTIGEVLRVYWIMPFPGSQGGGANTLTWAYAIHRFIWIERLLVGVVAAWSLAIVLARGSRLARVLVTLGLAVFCFVAYQTNGPMSADVMFRQPSVLRFADAALASIDPQALVVGIELPVPGGGSQARAYPMQVIGHHHQVRDTVAGQPVMVTYCTVCRTGRVFSPVVRGEVDTFRLVGMNHWNAMFEDSRTGSWFRQATGEAVVGPLRGERIAELPSQQVTWAAWLALHPTSDVLEPDPLFSAEYAHLDGFDHGTNKGSLTGRDAGSWGEKSWVVGVVAGGAARAFDWNELVRDRVIADEVGGVPVLLVLGADGASLFAFDARLPGEAAGGVVRLERTDDPAVFHDPTTGTNWSESGRGLDGPTAGSQLASVPAYQEFWHSWRTFHPDTTARREGAGE